MNTGIEELIAIFQQVCSGSVNKIIISKSLHGENQYKKIEILPMKDKYQISQYTDKQVFHENISADDLAFRCAQIMASNYGQANAWDGQYEHMIMQSKKGGCTYKKRKLKKEESI